MTPGCPSRGMPHRRPGTEKEVVKPLGIFAGIVVIGVVLIAAGLRLTDRSASAMPPLPIPTAQAQFVRAGNGVCARYYEEVMATFEGRETPKTVKMDARYIRLGMPAMVRLYAGLRALVPPRSQVRTYRRLLRVAGRELHRARAELHAFEAGQAGRARLIDRHARRQHFDRRYNSLSREVGLTICGLSGRQVVARYG